MIKNKTALQSNFITSGRYGMSVLEKDILYVVLSQLKKSDNGTQIYLVVANDIKEVTGKSISIANFKNATEKLISRVIDGKTADNKFLQVGFISSAEYIIGRGVIEIGLSPKILPFYLDLKKIFTSFELDIALSLRSIYAKRLYEIMSMYKNFKNPKFTVNLTEFKQQLEIIDPKTGKDKYESFSAFKINVLDPSEKEINGATDINFSYVAVEGVKHGKGRKPIERLEFTVKKVNQAKMISINPNDKDNFPLFTVLTTDFKLRKDQAITVLNTFSRGEINKELYAIRLYNVNGRLKSIGAYTARIFNLV